jgi:hypothetical protein
MFSGEPRRSALACCRSCLALDFRDGEMSDRRVLSPTVRQREDQPTFVPPMLLTTGAGARRRQLGA